MRKTSATSISTPRRMRGRGTIIAEVEDEEQKAVDLVREFLDPFLEGSEDYLHDFSPGVEPTPRVRKGEVALAAQTLLLWKSSRRIERLTRWLIALTAALLVLTAILAILTWRLA